MAPLKIAIIGSGNWGSAIARIIGENVKKNSSEFDQNVRMWVFEEKVDGRNLTEIINQDHENVKYLPGKKIPENVVAVPDLVQAVTDADVLVFVIPHQFVSKSCNEIKGKIKSSAISISLIKGLLTGPGGQMKLITDEIKEILKTETSVLMGANIANEVADDKFCEATIGSRNAKHGDLLKKIFQTDNFRITVVSDDQTVEVCGALKNVVACAAGFCDGLKYGDNTKAAFIRLGMFEMIKFTDQFFKGSKQATFFESCGVADLITTCYGGRNRKCSEAFVTSGKSIEDLEKEMLNGQKLQGPETAVQISTMLAANKMEDKFPMFTGVHNIFKGKIKPEQLVDCLRQHPAHL
jgi:glycerol-3-phosphate dehydrogenase (NAD+)